MVWATYILWNLGMLPWIYRILRLAENDFISFSGVSLCPPLWKNIWRTARGYSRPKPVGASPKQTFRKCCTPPKQNMSHRSHFKIFWLIWRLSNQTCQQISFLKNRQEVLQLYIRELTEAVVLFKDRLEVTLSKFIADRLGLKKPSVSLIRSSRAA